MNPSVDKNSYDESKILTLSALEHIRQRPGMYIGRLGNGSNVNDGIYILLKEVIDNSIDEFIMGCGNRIEIKLEGRTVSVRDYGRGIPFGKLVDCVSQINTGGKFNTDVFQYSVGLNGVGTKAVNALSSSFSVVSHRDGKFAAAEFEKGILVKEYSGDTTEKNGTRISFTPDDSPELFGDYSFHEDFIEDRLSNYAFLNTGLTLDFNGKIFKSKDGLLDLLKREVGDGGSVYEIIHYTNKQKTLEFAFTHLNGTFNENYYSYVNGQHTSDGGTHQAAFKEGIHKGICEYFKANWVPAVVREGIIGAISIKLQSPVFESQTKNKLGNTEIRSWIVQEVKDAVLDYLLKHEGEAQRLKDKIVATEVLHKQIADVKKASKEVANKTKFNIPKLRDCRFHLGQTGPHAAEGENSMIFLTEGDSAGGTMTHTRDALTQAIFALRGKPKNVFGQQRTAIYSNEELLNIMIALGIENGIDGLRYGKVIIATDADVDGFHIRNLLMTFFLTYFEDLVLAGRLFVLETPLFRVRNKQVVEYCYNEKERDAAIAKIKSAEVTRFKGLGEIDPKEFGQFIGDKMKLIPVDVSSVNDMKKWLQFYMDDNTPERRQFIVENLILGDIG